MIAEIGMPDWIIADNFSFDLKKVLQDSLYYPSSNFDGKPVTHLMGNIYSFIYADYGVTKKMLAPKGWNVQLSPDYDDINRMQNFQSFIKEPFCEWIISERDSDKDDNYNPVRFSLLSSSISNYRRIWKRPHT